MFRSRLEEWQTFLSSAYLDWVVEPAWLVWLVINSIIMVSFVRRDSDETEAMLKFKMKERPEIDKFGKRWKARTTTTVAVA